MKTMMTNHIQQALRTQGYSLVQAHELPMLPALDSAWQALRDEYAHLPPDNYLPAGGQYRWRRFSSFVLDGQEGTLTLLPHREYFQDTTINAVTGGIVRHFEPLTPRTVANPFLHELIRWDFAQFPLDHDERIARWQVDVHQIEVVSEVGSHAEPTPEGIHRDGARFVSVHLAQLDNADGGDVSIYDDDKSWLASFRLDHIMHSYLFNDAILWHGVTPITSRDGVNKARRSILTFDYHDSVRL